MTATAQPEVEGLYTSSGDEVRLVAGRCTECDSWFFPSHAALHRPNCSGGPVETTTMSPRGTLVSYTVQRYAPPPPFVAPEPYEPMPMGTVAFPEGIQIPGMLTGIGIEELRVGIEMEVTTAPLYVAEDGTTRTTYKFRPTTEGAAQ